MHYLYGGYNLHWFSDALGLVEIYFCSKNLSLTVDFKCSSFGKKKKIFGTPKYIHVFSC